MFNKHVFLFCNSRSCFHSSVVSGVSLLFTHSLVMYSPFQEGKNLNSLLYFCCKIFLIAKFDQYFFE